LHPEVMIHVIFLQNTDTPFIRIDENNNISKTLIAKTLNHWCMPALITLTNFVINDQAKLHPVTNLLGTKGIYLWGWL
jgi:hypothetical protein